MNLIQTLEILGFNKASANEYVISISGYKISVSLNSQNEASSSINYGSSIVVHNRTTSNFRHPESIVVLECVIRLLRIGYSPKSIELEKTWKLGHKGKGRLDILLKTSTGKSFALIECKTWGKEYSSERNNTLEDGGQLFSYYMQERSAKLLVLYSSKIEAGSITEQDESIVTQGLIGQNAEELFTSWDKSLVPNTIFENKASLYLTEQKALIKSSLKELDRETGSGIFNSFAEILRRHVVSDKSNAFNKIFNLFVCKIYDEDTKTDTEELDFQWRSNDSNEDLIERLSALYQNGLRQYLGIDTNEEFLSPLAEFAFIDVYDSRSYIENSNILREVVELLQGFQIKYSSKHQFLGDFFEKLLNTGVKQESGQFFTPIPLARFILRSLPIQQIIDTKIDDKETHILPYIIDYACGSGHFLTESMDEVQEHSDKIDRNRLAGSAKSNFESSINDFIWAKDYIYGVENDYRLAKTTKIAMFLNGDGDATIVNGDGLDDFYTSSTYKNLLKTDKPSSNLEKFDIVVSNPPFSVAGFKRYLKKGEDNFSLYKYLSPRSSEIECLFIERIVQLLKPGGTAGVILPLSILGNKSRIYSEARKKILIEFELNGLVELRDKTFVATGTTTVAVFLKRRSQADVSATLSKLIDEVTEFKNTGNVSSDIQKSIEHFKLDTTDLVKDIDKAYKVLGQKKFDTTELPEAFTYLLLSTLNSNLDAIISFSGDKKEQERFLGYRFSNSRGQEGIHYYQNNGAIESALYNSDDINDLSKVSTHIRNAFQGKYLDVPEESDNLIKKSKVLDLIQSDSYTIKNPSEFFENKHLVVSSNSPLGDTIDSYDQSAYKLFDLISSGEVEYISGLVYPKSKEVPRKTNTQVLTASNLDLSTGKILPEAKTIYLVDDFEVSDSIQVRKNDILISNASGSLKHLGKVAFAESDLDAVIGGFLSILRFKNVHTAKAFYYRLMSAEFRKYVATLKDQNINNLTGTELKDFVFHIPKDTERFYNDVTKMENEISSLNSRLNTIRNT